jgi:alcohol dehydrogenase
VKSFLFKSLTKVKFGAGVSLELAEILQELGAKKPMIVSGPNVSKTACFQGVKDALIQKGYEPVLYCKTVVDPPIEEVDAGADVLRQSGCDVVIAIGGGSPIDTAKAMCMLACNEGSVRDYLFGGTRTVQKPSMPLICVPTTAGSGSEVTAASVITDNQNDVKLSVTHESLFPIYAVVDPLFHVGMPAFITATTGMDALTHALESYVSLNANPISEAYGAAAMKLIAANLCKAYESPEDLEARSGMAVASSMAATAYVNGGLGAVHGIAQAMGGVAHVAHGQANAMMLPWVMEKNIKGSPQKFAEIAGFLGADTTGMTAEQAAQQAVTEVRRLVEVLNIPGRLRDVGVTLEMFPAIIKGTMEYRLLAINPVKLTAEDVADILEKAY